MTDCFAKTSLGESTVDVAFILNTYATPRGASLFQPLDPYMAKDPIEDPNDLFPGLVKGVTLDGKLFAVPFRHASDRPPLQRRDLRRARHQGSAADHGRAGRGSEEMHLYARRRHTGDRHDPARRGIPEVIAVARAWDADFITPT